MQPHINLHPVNFIIISGIIQSIVLAAILICRRGNRVANISIGVIVLICSLHFSWPIVIDTNIADIFRWSFWFPYSFLLAIGPLLLIYTRSLSEAGFSTRSKDWLHFFPVVAEAGAQLIFIIRSVLTDELFYEVPGFLYFRIIEFSVATASIFFYGKQSLSILRKHESWVIENYSNKKDVTLHWLYRLIKYFRVLLASWLVFELSFLIFQQFQLHFIPIYLLLYVLLLIMTYSCYWIGIQALIKSEVLAEKKTGEVSSEQTSSYAKLGSSLLNQYATTIGQLMQQEKLFLEETLNLRTLAARVKLDPNLVSYVLNTVVKKSFYDYVNEFRVNEMKRKIEDPAYSHIKIVELAFESGFNSKATFNRVFKKLTGISPTEYKTGAHVAERRD